MKPTVRGLRVRPHGERHVHVAGTLDVEGHHLPFAYKLSHDAPHAEHEKKLREHHAKGLVWATARGPHNRWAGGTERVGGTAITIVFCEIQAFGPHDWRLTVIWEENADGQTLRHTLSFHAAHPGALMSHEKLKARVLAEAAARGGRKGKLSGHIGAVKKLLGG